MSFVRKFLVFKQWQMRAQSHTAWILLAISVTINAATLFAVKELSMWYPVIIFTIILGALTLIGYLDVKYKIFDKEASLTNERNPEIQEILKILREIQFNMRKE